jgi:outer membrane protein W
MKLSRLLVILCLVLSVTPAVAQSRWVDINAFVTWMDPSGENAFRFEEDDLDFQTDFDAEQGWGLAVNVFWSNRISTEFAASVVEPDFHIRAEDPTIPFAFSQGLEILPISAVLQLHLLPASSFDPYVGVGGAYVLFEDIEGSDDLGDIDIDQIDFDDDIGLVFNAGVNWAFTPNFGLYLDGKYVPLESAARAVFPQGASEPIDIEVNPLMLSAGISFRF